MDHSKKATYIFSIDVLRVLAILAVIAIHLTTKTLTVNGLDTNAAPYSLFVNQSVRFAVPLFFLISGFVLHLNYKPNLSYILYLKNRASRILIPYIFWSMFYFLFGNAIFKLFSSQFALTLFEGTASYHLYFIPTLIIFYLILPLLYKMRSLITRPSTILLLFMVQLLIISYDYYYQSLNLPYFLRIAVLSWGMFVLGFSIKDKLPSILNYIKPKLKFFMIIILIFTIVLYLHSKMLFDLTRKIGYIYSQYHPLNYVFTLLLGGGVLAYLDKKKTNGFVVTLSKLSLFVFFVHVFIFENLWTIIVNPVLSNFGKSIVINPLFDISVFLMITTIFFLLAFVIHKIPYANRITG